MSSRCCSKNNGRQRSSRINWRKSFPVTTSAMKRSANSSMTSKILNTWNLSKRSRANIANANGEDIPANIARRIYRRGGRSLSVRSKSKTVNKPGIGRRTPWSLAKAWPLLALSLSERRGTLSLPNSKESPLVFYARPLTAAWDVSPGDDHLRQRLREYRASTCQ